MRQWSFRAWILLCAAAFVLIALYYSREILPPFVVALVLVYLLNPAVTRVARVEIRGIRCPRILAVLFVLAVLAGALTALLSGILPALAQEVGPFRATVVGLYHQLVDNHLPNFQRWLQTIADQAGVVVDIRKSLREVFEESYGLSNLNGASIVLQAQKAVSGVLGALFSILLVSILSLFLLIDWPRLENSFWNLVPHTHQTLLRGLVQELDKDLSGAIRGQLSICLINFVLTTLGLLLLEVKYAVTLGVIAGIFSIVPVFGSIVSTLPIVLVALTVSFLSAVKAVVVIIVIHLLEANILNPKVMGAHVELHPVVILFALVAAEHWVGPVGLLIGVPIAASIRSIIQFVYSNWFQPEMHHPSPGKGPTDGQESQSLATSG